MMSERRRRKRQWLAAQGDALPPRPRRGKKRYRGTKALHVASEEFRAIEPHIEPTTSPLRVSLVRRWLHRDPTGETMTTTQPSNAEQTTGAIGATDTEQADDRPSEAVVLACDIATGAAKDPTANAIMTKGAWRNLNAKGNGTETYRRALSPGGAWRFVSPERLPRGTFLAADRGACVRGDVYVGDLIADFDRSLRGGRSQGEAKHDGKIGLVISATDGKMMKDDVEWMDVTRQKDGTWRIVLPTGAHLTFASPVWR